MGSNCVREKEDQSEEEEEETDKRKKRKPKKIVKRKYTTFVLIFHSFFRPPTKIRRKDSDLSFGELKAQRKKLILKIGNQQLDPSLSAFQVSSRPLFR